MSHISVWRCVIFASSEIKHMIVQVLIGITILHLIAGFAFMIWKLNGPVKEEDESDEEPQNTGKE